MRPAPVSWCWPCGAGDPPLEVDQVVHDVDAVEGGRQAGPVEHVAAHDLHVVTPGPVVALLLLGARRYGQAGRPAGPR